MNRKKLDDLVFARDHGVCQRCGLDAEELHRSYKAALNAADERHTAVMREQAVIGYRVFLSAQQRTAERKAIADRMRGLGFVPGARPYQSHHVLALSEGGRSAVANMTTLCTRCHAEETKATQARLARKPVKHVLEIHETRTGERVWR